MKIRLVALALFAFVILLALFLLTSDVFTADTPAERIANGSFEEGFGPDGLARGWGRFDSGGDRVVYGWHPDSWTPVVFEGKSSQLIEINTLGFADSLPDRYAGIYQTVAVAAGTSYQFTLWGLLRAREGDPDAGPNGYRAQFGYDPSGGNDWKAVTNWTDLGINNVYNRLSPGAFTKFTTNITPAGNRLTLFIRVWKKWGTGNREVDFNVDSVSLTGSTPANTAAPSVTLTVPGNLTVGRAANISVKTSNGVGVTSIQLMANNATVGTVSFKTGTLSVEQSFAWTPSSAGTYTLKATVMDASGKSATATKQVTVGANAEFLTNGSFEGGFQGNGVANNWTGFTNGGANTKYTFMDDSWAPVVYDGSHSQLIEIDSFGFAAGDPDRYAGICQTVSGLTVDAQYRLTVRGWLRTQPSDPDVAASGYIVQYGFDPTASGDWTKIGNWTQLDLGQPSVRLSPGSVATATATFAAPSQRVTLCLRLWKKWATSNREVDLNLDGLSLTGFK